MTNDITAHTQLVGLIGWPVGHSISPRMHNAAFNASNLDWCYVPLAVPDDPPERLAEAIHGLRALSFRGANVTVPHKQSVIQYLDELTDAAQTIGAVNTIIVQKDGVLVGDNTDARGFIADLLANGMDPSRKRVLVLGAGGSARAVVTGLAEMNVNAIMLANRTVSKAEELTSAVHERYPDIDIEVVNLPGDVSDLDADLIVNCTSVGMEPDSHNMPWNRDIPFQAKHFVYDLVYNPSPTLLVRFASECGAHAVNGKGMLVWQGALAFECWTGHPGPVDVMKASIGD